MSLKDLSHKLQTNCIISFYFYLYLMLHTCAARFDVTENFKKNYKIFWKLNKLWSGSGRAVGSGWIGCDL
jgi:hypothetical protein